MNRQRGVSWILFGSALALEACIGAHDSLVGGEDPDGTGGNVAGSGGSISTGGSSTQGGSNPTGGSSSGGSSGVGGNAGQNSGAAGTGTGARGGANGSECDPNSAPPVGAADGILLMPDCNGWIDRADNPLGVQGWWYPFGDQYPGPYDSKCLLVGMHPPAECSIVHSPTPPPSLGFPQAERGEMCTSGETAEILPCAPGVATAGCQEKDYANITGAGIAVDFNAGRDEDGGAKHPWDPSAAGVIGFSFEVDQVPARFRVEIPMVLTDEEAATVSLPAGATTDQHPDGSPYWGASQFYPPSPVTPGENRILWSDIRPPRTSYEFDPTRMLGIQFHVTPGADSRTPYAFCIKNLTLLEQ